MRNIFKAFAKKLFGAKYERLKKALLMNLAVFWTGRVLLFRKISNFLIAIFSPVCYILNQHIERINVMNIFFMNSLRRREERRKFL